MFEIMYFLNEYTTYFSSISSQDQKLGSKILFFESRSSQIRNFLITIRFKPVDS